MGRSFAGVYELRTDIFRRVDVEGQGEVMDGPDDPRLRAARSPEHEADEHIESVMLAKEGRARASMRRPSARASLTPVLFGSALRNFGVSRPIHPRRRRARTEPASRSRPGERTVRPDEAKMTGFVFKIQANMDPKHRDPHRLHARLLRDPQTAA